MRLNDRVFSILRGEGEDAVLVLINTSKESVTVETGFEGSDLISGKRIGARVQLKAYDYLWIKQG